MRAPHTYQHKSATYGAIINSNKPIVYVILSSGTFLTVGTQLPPHTTWGNSFLLSDIGGESPRDKSFVYGTLFNNTDVKSVCTVNGMLYTYFTTLIAIDQETDLYVQGVSSAPNYYCYVQSTKPIIIIFYILEIGSSNFMTVIPPTSQYLNRHKLVSLQYDSDSQRYITVLVPANPFTPHNNILINGNPLEPNATLWQNVFNIEFEIGGYAITISINDSLCTLSHNRGILVFSYYINNQNMTYGHVNGIGLQQENKNGIIHLFKHYYESLHWSLGGKNYGSAYYCLNKVTTIIIGIIINCNVIIQNLFSASRAHPNIKSTEGRQ